jgi:hypothetical protein
MHTNTTWHHERPHRQLSRCAIYTRKSTEHNLDLAFNSLDAQREACEAYIASRRRSRPSPSRLPSAGPLSPWRSSSARFGRASPHRARRAHRRCSWRH